MENFKVKECRFCGFEVEEIDEGHYYCHNCGKDLLEDDVREEDLLTDGYVKRHDNGTVEVKGFLNIVNLFNS